MVLREILYGLAGNFIFSLCLYTYKKYHHKHYDEIIARLKQLDQMNYEQQNNFNEEVINRLKRIEQNNDAHIEQTNSARIGLQFKDRVGYFTDNKCENIKWLAKDEHYKNNI